MNPPPEKAGFETPNPPFFDGSIDDRFAEAMSRSRKAVSQILRKYPHDVDDILQNAAVKAFLQFQSFRADAEFNTWFYRIATNEALQHLRRFRNGIRNAESMTDMVAVLSIKAQAPTPEDQVLEKERRTVLANMVRRLKPCGRRETLAVLIDEPLDRPRNNREKSAYHHAKTRLRQMCSMDFTLGLFTKGDTR